MLYEGDAEWTLREGIGTLRPKSIALLIGPEGGFVDSEAVQARDCGVLPVRFGPRILRTETAAIAGVSLLQGLLGDLA